MHRLSPSKCILLLCDVQERFRTKIYKFDAVIDAANRLIHAANTLKIPIIATEQYPKALGTTVNEIDLKKIDNKFEKTCFTMLSPEVNACIETMDFDAAVLVGIEAHVCVQQTALDLITQGKSVHLCVDGISSQRPTDRSAGLFRAERAGAVLTSAESVMMELIRGKDHPHFKEISSILKSERPAQELEFPY